MQHLANSFSMRAPALIFTACMIATGAEIFGLTSSINEAPPLEQDFTTLTPHDFVSLPQGEHPHHLGLHDPGSPTSGAPILTDAISPKAWLPDTEGISRTELSKRWYELSFPDRQNLPSLLQATVTTAPIAKPDETRPCPRLSPGHFSCDKPSWAAVQSREVLVNGEKVSCIWAHPLQGRITTITYPDIASTGATPLSLEVAFHDNVTKDPARSIPITLTHGTQRARHIARSNKKGWQIFPVELMKEDTSHPLVLTLQANQPGRHQLCYRFQKRTTP